MDAWWSNFFDQTYADMGLETRDEARRELAVDRIVALLGVAPGARIFDQCCGIGRISVPLARRGYRVTGVDLAPGYADTAATRAANAECDFHTADAFEFVAPVPCDAGINWFTSFGYHRDDRVNVQMLHRAHASLVPGARFALDYTNFPRVFGDYRAAIVDRVQDTIMIQEPVFDFVAGMIVSTWTYVHGDGRREQRHTENRTYLPHELVRLFGEAGFVDVELHAPGGAYERTSPRLIVVGRRP